MNEKSTDATLFVAFEEQRRRAMLTADIPALQSLFAPDLYYVHFSGVRDNRGGVLANLATGAVAYEALSFENLAVTVTPDAALVTGEMRARIQRDGQVRGVSSCYLAVWLRRDGAWRLGMFQATKLPVAG